MLISSSLAARIRVPARKGFHFEVPARHDVVQSRHSEQAHSKVLAIP